MANNISITQGSGTTMATDDVGSVHYQKTKIEYGAAGKVTSDAKYAVIAASSSGDNTIVAAVASNKIRVLSYVLSASAAVNAKWKNGATDISGLIYMDAKGGAVAPEAPKGHMQTSVNTALILNLSGAIPVGGHLTYVEEP